ASAPVKLGSGGTSRSSRPRRTWLQRLVIAANIVLIFLCLSSAWALGFYSKQFSDIPKISPKGLTAQSDPSQPQNFLLLGVANAEGLDANDPVLRGRDPGETLGDAIMILRVDPNQQQASLLSLPRDLWVNIAGNRGQNKINAAMAYGNGQPDLLIQTIKDD